MNDADAVGYATTAARTADPHELRQWLTSRGKDVAQSALPSAPLPAPAVMTVERDPDPVSVPARPLSLPAAPRPRPRPRPVNRESSTPVPIRRPRQQDHPRWAETEALYRASIEKGAKLSQRKLSDTLGVHRNLARAVIAHVDDDLFPEG